MYAYGKVEADGRLARGRAIVTSCEKLESDRPSLSGQE